MFHGQPLSRTSGGHASTTKHRLLVLFDHLPPREPRAVRRPAAVAGLGGAQLVARAAWSACRGNVASTRPIAGTRPRIGGDDDAARLRELIGHPKERAEHVMLIDLERNDLGRVCAPAALPWTS